MSITCPFCQEKIAIMRTTKGKGFTNIIPFNESELDDVNRTIAYINSSYKTITPKDAYLKYMELKKALYTLTPYKFYRALASLGFPKAIPKRVGNKIFKFYVIK